MGERVREDILTLRHTHPPGPPAAFALKANLLRVVQLSLLGSVISNLLLVMGTAFVAGGILNPEQTFSKQVGGGFRGVGICMGELWLCRVMGVGAVERELGRALLRRARLHTLNPEP